MEDNAHESVKQAKIENLKNVFNRIMSGLKFQWYPFSLSKELALGYYFSGLILILIESNTEYKLFHELQHHN